MFNLFAYFYSRQDDKIFTLICHLWRISNKVHVHSKVVICVCRLQKKAQSHNMIVASYDVVRNDIDFFR